MSTETQPSFETQVFAGLHELQQALLGVFASANVDSARAFPAARKLQVNKNLTWKASKIIRAQTPSEALNHLPGKAGVKLLLDALASAGASAEAVARAASAITEFDRVIEAHASDKETLELMLDSLNAGPSEQDNLEKSRRLAFLGNSGIWGIQAQTRLITHLLSPNEADAGAFDLTLLLGFLELKRLRAAAPWILMRTSSYRDDGSRRQRKNVPLSPAPGEPEGSPILAEFSTPGMPPCTARDSGAGLVLDLPQGPAGNQGSFDILTGHTDFGYANMYADGDNKIGQFLAGFHTPIRHAQFDVLIHKDLPQFDQVHFELFSRDRQSAGPPPSGSERFVIPIKTEIERLGLGLAALASERWPRYQELVALAATKRDTSPEDYEAYRVRIDYPPMGTKACFWFPLLPKP